MTKGRLFRPELGAFVRCILDLGVALVDDALIPRHILMADNSVMVKQNIHISFTVNIGQSFLTPRSHQFPERWSRWHSVMLSRVERMKCLVSCSTCYVALRRMRLDPNA